MKLYLDVGTRLYIAPEVMSSKGGPRDHTKADIYSLGVRFAYKLVASVNWDVADRLF